MTRGRKLWYLCELAVILIIAAGLVNTANAAGIRLVTREASLGRIPMGVISETFAVSPDCQHVAYGALKGNKWVAVVDNKDQGKEHEAILKGTPVFSPDGKRVAYGAQESKKWLLVVDGSAGKPYDEIMEGSVVFSPDSRRMAYGARIGRKWSVVMDGQEGKWYSIITKGPVFSPDSKRMAYVAQSNWKYFPVVDGLEGNQYDGIIQNSRLIFDNPKHLHGIMQNRGQYMKIDIDIVPQ